MRIGKQRRSPRVVGAGTSNVKDFLHACRSRLSKRRKQIQLDHMKVLLSCQNGSGLDFSDHEAFHNHHHKNNNNKRSKKNLQVIRRFSAAASRRQRSLSSQLTDSSDTPLASSVSSLEDSFFPWDDHTIRTTSTVTFATNVVENIFEIANKADLDKANMWYSERDYSKFQNEMEKTLEEWNRMQKKDNQLLEDNKQEGEQDQEVVPKLYTEKEYYQRVEESKFQMDHDGYCLRGLEEYFYLIKIKDKQCTLAQYRNKFVQKILMKQDDFKSSSSFVKAHSPHDHHYPCHHDDALVVPLRNVTTKKFDDWTPLANVSHHASEICRRIAISLARQDAFEAFELFQEPEVMKNTPAPVPPPSRVQSVSSLYRGVDSLSLQKKTQTKTIESDIVAQLVVVPPHQHGRVHSLCNDTFSAVGTSLFSDSFDSDLFYNNEDYKQYSARFLSYMYEGIQTAKSSLVKYLSTRNVDDEEEHHDWIGLLEMNSQSFDSDDSSTDDDSSCTASTAIIVYNKDSKNNKEKEGNINNYDDYGGGFTESFLALLTAVLISFVLDKFLTMISTQS